MVFPTRFPRCPMHDKLPKDPKVIAGTCLRVSFGLALLLVGVSHYQGISDFTGMVSDGLGPLTMLGTLWAYILPALFIVGGALIVAKQYPDVATWCIGLGLGSIPVGMTLKPVLSNNPAGLGEAMGMANNALLWLIVFIIVVKWCCCCGSCKAPSGGGGGGYEGGGGGEGHGM